MCNMQKKLFSHGKLLVALAAAVVVVVVVIMCDVVSPKFIFIKNR